MNTAAVRRKAEGLTRSCPTLCEAPVDGSPPGSFSMEFSRQEYWSGLPFPAPGDLLYSGLEAAAPAAPALAGMDSLPPSHLKIILWGSKKWDQVKVAQSCLALCDPVDYTVHGILQARILEWVASPVSRGSSQPGDRTQVPHIAGGFFTSWTTREVQEYWSE